MLNYSLLISGLVDRASSTETVHLGSIAGQFKLKTLRFGIDSFLLDVQH